MLFLWRGEANEHNLHRVGKINVPCVSMEDAMEKEAQDDDEKECWKKVPG
jgi:hypothetical protein